MALTQGFFLNLSNTQKKQKNNLKWDESGCSACTQAKAGALSLCSSVKKIVVASSECPRTYIFKLKTILEATLIQVTWVELAGGWS